MFKQNIYINKWNCFENVCSILILWSHLAFFVCIIRIQVPTRIGKRSSKSKNDLSDVLTYYTLSTIRVQFLINENIGFRENKSAYHCKNNNIAF